MRRFVRFATPRVLFLLSVPIFAMGLVSNRCLPSPWEANFDNVVRLEAGPDFEEDFREAVLTAIPGTILKLPAGYHRMTGTITLETSHVIIRGAGMVLPDPETGEYSTACPADPTKDCGTILDYDGQAFGSQGILVFGDHFQIDHLTILNTLGDGVKTQDITGARFGYVHVNWPAVDDLTKRGAYGLYPAEGVDVHIYGCDVRGVRDAGIYVGQSDNIIVEDNYVEGNVIGIELENTKNGEIRRNVATDNTAGIAVFDLPNLEESYGTRVYENKIYKNNHRNFAAGGIISLLPRGTGLIIIGSKDVEVFDNLIFKNLTVNAIAASFHISLEIIDDEDYNPFTHKVHIHDNDFAKGRQAPAQFGAIIQSLFNGYCDELSPEEAEAEPGCVVDPECDRPPAQQHLCVDPIIPDIVFGGWADPDHFLPDCSEVAAGEPCAPADALPKVLRLDPSIRNCAQNNVKRDGTLLIGMLNGYEYWGDDVDLYDESHFDCSHDPLLPVQIPPPTVPPEVDAGLTPEETALLCEGLGQDPTTVNWDAYVANCPFLHQYRLFEGDDPRTAAQGGGMKYELTTPLFSDYAAKDRYVFLPPDGYGGQQPMLYSADRVFELPVGTIITKTFSFQDANGGSDRIAETRLLIHRPGGWEGLPFIRDPSTGLFALSIGGGVVADVAVSDPGGTTHVFDYPIPDMAQCGTCHFGPSDRPIGLKARLLNRGFGASPNQLVGWVDAGLLVDGLDPLPASPTAADFDRIPFFDDPADGTLEERATGYLESNCGHCHNPLGRAGFTSMHLTWRHPIDIGYGVCKRPIAAGGGAFTDEFDARVDIEPGDHGRSISWRRMESDDPARMMPELARVLVHQQGLDVVGDWIDIDLAHRAGECDLLEGP